MNHDHTQQNACPYCKPHQSSASLTKGIREKLLSSLGVCGSLSCYFAMFPTILLGIVGVVGLSTSAASTALNAYLNSIFFLPVLIFSILLLIIGLIRYGNAPLFLSIVSGVGIFISMNLYMREWLFTLSFALLSLAYFLAYKKAKSVQLKTALILISAVVILGIIGIGRAAFSSPNPQNSNIHHQQMQQMPPLMMQMQ